MTRQRGGPRAALLSLVAAALCAEVAGCHGKRERNWDPDPPPPANLPAAVAVHRASATAHPRILFTAETRKGLQAAVKAQTPWWKQLEHRCSIFEGGDISGGYLGLQWADAIGSLTTCYYATGDNRYRDRAVVYLRALLNDARDFGDGKGGDDIVHGNSGYPIRAYGAYAALAFDWLHDAPGMDELRPVIIKRLDAWLSWYTDKGYLNDSVYSNYYWGYFTTLALAGLATDGEAAQAKDWLARTRSMLDKKIIPGFYSRLAGGEWAEGWQYGQLVALEVSLVVDAFYTATGADYARSFPWIADLVPAQLFRMHPDYRTSYGNGTQAEQPPPSEPSGLADAILVLRRTDPGAAARARFIVHHLMQPHHNERLWFAVAAGGAGGKEVDPRDPGVLSYHLPGPGQTFMRSSWDPTAVWVSFQAGARIAIDHQHNDQGHFTLWRGSDPLIGEFDREQGYATINHNSLLIDDGGAVLTYPPNQGVWARNSRTLRWHDTGRAVVVVGDLADAWAPHCVERGCTERAVKKEIRTLVYLRPNVVVTDDDLTLAAGSSGATWEAHVKAQPHLGVARGLGRTAPAAASAVVGGSRVDMVAIEPAGAKLSAPAEPTTSDDHIYKADVPKGPVWRVQFDTPRGKPDRRIRVWMRAGAAGDPSPQAQTLVRAVTGTGLSGAAGRVGTDDVAVLFADTPAGGSAVVPEEAVRALVVGLTPRASMKVEVSSLATSSQGPGCSVRVTAAKGATALAVGAGGELEIDLSACHRAARAK